tara:strand:- start:6871 stop:7080 length:210 start_codon:yes stop_codon:yes gene_type:complete
MTDWTEVFAKHLNTNIPEGFETTAQIAKKAGANHSATYERLKVLLKRGLVDCVEVTHNGKNAKAWKQKT